MVHPNEAHELMPDQLRDNKLSALSSALCQKNRLASVHSDREHRVIDLWLHCHWSSANEGMESWRQWPSVLRQRPSCWTTHSHNHKQILDHPNASDMWYLCSLSLGCSIIKTSAISACKGGTRQQRRLKSDGKWTLFCQFTCTTTKLG